MDQQKRSRNTRVKEQRRGSKCGARKTKGTEYCKEMVGNFQMLLGPSKI